MSYLSQAHDPRRRATALTITVAVHALVGVAVVTGLTVSGYRPFDEYKPIVDIRLDPPPPPKPDPQPQEKTLESKVTAPLPPIDLVPIDRSDDIPVAQPTDTEVTFVVDRGEVIQPVRPVDPPAPLFTPRGARPTNNPLRWITTDDYPARALRSEAEGIASYRVIVATSGRPAACEVTRSTGNGQLDDATCEYIMDRARFDAATDETGAKVVGSYSGKVKWEIPD